MQAAELVPGDLVKLSLGAVVAADVKLTAGTLAAAAVLAVILDLVKVRAFRRLGIT